MEKTGIAFIYVTSIVVLGILLFQTVQSRRKNVFELKSMICLGMIMNGVFLLSLFWEDKFRLSLIYTAELMLEGWTLLMFLHYAYRRMKGHQKEQIWFKRGFLVLLLVDNVLLLVNAFTELFFRFRVVERFQAVYVCAEWSVFFVIHWAGCIAIAALVVRSLFLKAWQVARIYRRRYIAGSVVFSLWLLLEMAARLISDNMNMWSVSLITLGILCFYAMYFLYPMMRIQRMKTFAINNMSDPVLMFDYNNNLQVYNEAAERMLGVTADYSMEQYIRENELYYTVEEHCDEKNKKPDFIRTAFLGGRTYLVHGQELWDEKDRLIGTLMVYADISNQEKLKDEATLYATRDQLTGLWNRDYFFEMATKTIRENADVEFCMVVSDVYQFKMFNEILGYSTGDDLLVAIAQAYRQKCKRMWVFSRISGGKFALLIPKKDFQEESFMAFVRDIFERKHYELKVHCYVGVYEITDRYISAESMYTRAFMALESIKGDLQKDVAYYHEEIRSKRVFETTTLDEMDRALLNNEFVIFLQPQIDIQSNQVVSAEALIRWKKPGRGIVPPAEFIPIFENNGMIARLDYHVWELACRQLCAWKQEGFENRSISVNISAKDFYLADLYESITGLVEKYRINPRNLKLEITETAFVLDVKKQMELVRKLQEYGFIIEIDDFGSGYSSLNSLKDISVDILKMDMKFFEKSDETNRAELIVKSVIQLANELGMPVIAEGVETEEDIEMLKRAGCQFVQGYYFSKPLPVEEYEHFLEAYAYGDMDKIISKVRNGR